MHYSKNAFGSITWALAEGQNIYLLSLIKNSPMLRLPETKNLDVVSDFTS